MESVSARVGVSPRPSPAGTPCDSMVAWPPHRNSKGTQPGDGTVTAFLERLVGEPVDAHRTRHEVGRAGTSSALQVAEGHLLLIGRRCSRVGRRAGPMSTPKASSCPAASPTDFRLRLDSTSDPIGRILDDQAISRDPGAPVRTGPARRRWPAGTRPPTGDCPAEPVLSDRCRGSAADGDRRVVPALVVEVPPGRAAVGLRSAGANPGRRRPDPRAAGRRRPR